MSSSSSYHEIVLNKCYGSFQLSEAALHEYTKRTSRTAHAHDIARDDPVLVQIVKELGDSANGDCSQLSIERIPSQYTQYYTINEYDGYESIQIQYDAYRVSAARAILQAAHLTMRERIVRALAVLGANLESES